jgi:hypothetical protein
MIARRFASLLAWRSCMAAWKNRLVEVSRLLRGHGGGPLDGTRGSVTIRSEPVEQTGVTG